MHAMGAMSADSYNRIFGVKDPRDMNPDGRRRLQCKTCGDFHLLDEPWPHNCVPPYRPSRGGPMITTDIEPQYISGVPISCRKDLREYIARSEGAIKEFDPGEGPPPKNPDDPRNWSRRQWAEKIKRTWDKNEQMMNSGTRAPVETLEDHNRSVPDYMKLSPVKTSNADIKAVQSNRAITKTSLGR